MENIKFCKLSGDHMGEAAQDKAEEPGFGLMFWVVFMFWISGILCLLQVPFPQATFSFLYYKKSVCLKISLYACVYA